MKTKIKIDRKSALLSALKLLPEGGTIELTLDPTAGHWNAVVEPNDRRSTPSTTGAKPLIQS